MKDPKEHLQKMVGDEYDIAKNNKVAEEFESYIDLLDSERREKDYDWMSDIRLPEFATHMLTQSSIDVQQYFQTRDFVEAYTEDEGDQAQAEAAAAKECINRTLNQKHIYHYQKYVRAKNINHLIGYAYALCTWEYDERFGVIGTEPRTMVGEGGEIIVVEEPIEGAITTKDRFNYHPLDPRNVFTDNKYVYSVQEKDFVIVRSEKTMNDLEGDADEMGYFDLDKIGRPPQETETSKETDNAEDKEQKNKNKYYDVCDRYGKAWAIVTERDEEGVPITAKIGIDEEGKPLKDAEFIECITTFVIDTGQKKLIGFKPTWAVDATGEAYKPLLRGLCYIHPSKDSGVGDGKYSKELQIAIDDTFNLSNDRVQLATMPTMKGKRHSLEDNSSIYIEPGHTIELNDVNDLVEMQFSDNIVGALRQIGILTGKMQQVTSIMPTTMGGLPDDSSTTATAIAGAEQRTNIRTNYKAMTFENTFLVDLYWMIQHMTYVFAKPETAMKLMGEKVYNFNPTRDYYYKPVSASIESEQSKAAKVQGWTQILGYISNIQHPDIVNQINYILGKIYTYMGDEYVNFGNTMLNPQQPIEGGSDQQEAMGVPSSNQAGVPQSGMEQAVRGNA